jgi:DNA-directed RNA polymerase alpha subunit
MEQLEYYHYPWGVDLKAVEENFDLILTDYFSQSKCFLTEREKNVILLRYKEKQTLEQVAQEFELTRERIRQIETKAIQKLKSKKDIFFDSFDEYKLIEKEYLRKRDELCKKVEELDELIEKANKLVHNKNTTIKEIEDFISLSQDEKKSLMIMNTDIADLDFSVRTINCLRRARINTVNELSKKTVEELMRIRNLGRKCLKEILETLREFEIYLD